MSENSDYAKPLPWIGLYVAAASLVCTICMIADLLRSFWWRKPWIGFKFFSFNAATLTFLAVATKIPSDITGAMPCMFDQFIKLSGVNFICIAMNHAMPSLGMMDGATIISNMIGIGILVITIFVNTWIQIKTKLIDQFLGFALLHMFNSMVMLFLLAILVSHSLTVTTIRRQLEKRYKSKHKEIIREMSINDISTRFSSQRLMEDVGKYWLMAFTSSADYGMRSSGVSFTSAILCWTVTGMNLVVLVSVFTKSYGDCHIGSDYGWSVRIILVTQIVAIAVGTVASILRILKSKTASSFSSWRAVFKIEAYRIQQLMEWREATLPLHISNRQARVAAHEIKNLVIVLFIILQYVVVLLSKLVIVLISAFAISALILSSFFFKNSYLYWKIVVYIAPVLLIKILPRVLSWYRSHYSRRSTEVPSGISSQDLSEFVLQIEGQLDEPNRIAQQWRNYPQKWIQNSTSNQPTQLQYLLTNYSSEGFSGVDNIFGNTANLATSQQELLNHWALPLVTLACIARTVLHHDEYKLLMKAMGEGLRYVTLVDNNNDMIKYSATMQKATNLVWHALDLYGRWFDEELKILPIEDFNSKISRLRATAEKHIKDFKNRDPIEWSEKAFVAKCLYMVSGAILQWTQDKKDSCFQTLQGIVADTISACLTNLPFAIFNLCSSGPFGAREVSVHEVVVVLGETEMILKLLEERSSMECLFYPANTRYLTSWCMNTLVL